MGNCAVIVDNRPTAKLHETIQRHMDFLPGWDLRRIHDIPIRSGNDYNQVLTAHSFWESLKYDRVLIFQHDSMLLREGIEEFLDYDYIGAPIKNFPFPAMNGGLSLRNPKAMLRCLREVPPASTPYAGHNEDIYFSYICKELGLNLPDRDTAEMFSVETMFRLGTLGLHAIDNYLTQNQCLQIRTQYE